MSAPIADLECVATLPFHLRRARPNSYSKPTSRELTAYVGVFLEHGRHALAGVRSGGATGDRSRGPPWCMVCCVCVWGGNCIVFHANHGSMTFTCERSRVKPSVHSTISGASCRRSIYVNTPLFWWVVRTRCHVSPLPSLEGKGRGAGFAKWPQLELEQLDPIVDARGGVYAIGEMYSISCMAAVV